MLTSALLALAACQGSAPTASEPSGNANAPDRIFVGKFLTLDEASPEVEAVAVAHGRITATGTRSALEALAGPDTELVAVPGVAVPGWVDAHVHVAGLGAQLEDLNVQSVNKQRIVAAVAEKVAVSEPGGWILGRGWDEGFFDVPEYPVATDLDAVSPENPVALSRIGGHSVWVNSRALELANIDATTEDPDGGRIVRDLSGAPTGMLLEQAERLVAAVMPDTETPEYRERRIRLALRQYAHWGLTGVHDAGSRLEDIATFKKLAASGELPIRIYSMANGNEAVEHYLAHGPEVGLSDGKLTVRSFKIYVDGALGARGAEMSEPYSDAPETTGLRQMQDAELDAFIAAARAKGFQVNGHVIGDLGVQRLLDAVERNVVTPEERFRLEHASIISPPNLPRFARLGVIASMQPVFIGEYFRWGVDRVGPERAPWIMPIADLLETGARFVASTDYPASDSGDPRTTLNALVNRTGFDGRPPGGWFPAQAVDVTTALRSMSEAAAFAAFQEDELGSLSVGRYADFTVLEVDPHDVPLASLLSIRVTMTVVGGDVVFSENEPQ